MAFRSKAFTLIEVIVILAITAILAAIIFPVFNRAIASAHSGSCLEGEKQISLALSLYTSDNADRYPPERFGIDSTDAPTLKSYYGFDAFWPYVKGDIRCSDSPRHTEVRTSMDSGYCFNSWMDDLIPIDKTHVRYVGLEQHRIAHTSTIVVFADCRAGIIATPAPDVGPGILPILDELVKYQSQEQAGASRHLEGGNYSFVDGHSKHLKATQFNFKCSGNDPSYVVDPQCGS